jgi:hypothetical protein
VVTCRRHDTQLSPALLRWVRMHSASQVPEGGPLAESVYRIVLNFVSLQALEEFFFVAFGMMRRLVRNVFHDALGLRGADAERAVSFLPCEIVARRAGFVQVFLKTAVQELNRVRQRHGWWNDQ